VGRWTGADVITEDRGATGEANQKEANQKPETRNQNGALLPWSLPLALRFWFLVSGFWFLVYGSGFWFLVCLSLVSGFWFASLWFLVSGLPLSLLSIMR
jgi:hypothetical protein